jgi:hypothetical protein
MGASGFTYQVQISRDGTTWTPMRPHTEGNATYGGMTYGEHWYDNHHKAWVAANRLRSNLMWADVQLVHKNVDGAVVKEEPIL